MPPGGADPHTGIQDETSAANLCTSTPSCVFFVYETPLVISVGCPVHYQTPRLLLHLASPEEGRALFPTPSCTSFATGMMLRVDSQTSVSLVHPAVPVSEYRRSDNRVMLT